MKSQNYLVDIFHSAAVIKTPTELILIFSDMEKLRKTKFVFREGGLLDYVDFQPLFADAKKTYALRAKSGSATAAEHRFYDYLTLLADAKWMLMSYVSSFDAKALRDQWSILLGEAGSAFLEPILKAADKKLLAALAAAQKTAEIKQQLVDIVFSAKAADHTEDSLELKFKYTNEGRKAADFFMHSGLCNYASANIIYGPESVICRLEATQLGMDAAPRNFLMTLKWLVDAKKEIFSEEVAAKKQLTQHWNDKLEGWGNEFLAPLLLQAYAALQQPTAEKPEVTSPPPIPRTKAEAINQSPKVQMILEAFKARRPYNPLPLTLEDEERQLSEREKIKRAQKDREKSHGM